MTPGAHPAVQDAHECLQLEQEHRQARQHDWLWRLRKAVLLSPTVDICEALLRGEQVPTVLLDQEALRRFGRRRVALNDAT